MASAPCLDRTKHFGALGCLYRYLIGRPWQIAFYLDFAKEAISKEVDPWDVTDCKQVADAVRERVRESKEARHIVLHWARRPLRTGV